MILAPQEPVDHRDRQHEQGILNISAMKECTACMEGRIEPDTTAGEVSAEDCRRRLEAAPRDTVGEWEPG
jgi:hypothetical protein